MNKFSDIIGALEEHLRVSNERGDKPNFESIAEDLRDLHALVGLSKRLYDKIARDCTQIPSSSGLRLILSPLGEEFKDCVTSIDLAIFKADQIK